METIDLAQRYSVVKPTTPGQTTLQSTTIQLANAWVDTIDVLFPAGHSGLTGFRIRYQGNVVLPWDGVGGFVIGNAERLVFMVGMYMPGVITVDTQNNDTIPHGHVVTFAWHTYQAPSSAPPAPLPVIVA